MVPFDARYARAKQPDVVQPKSTSLGIVLAQFGLMYHPQKGYTNRHLAVPEPCIDSLQADYSAGVDGSAVI